MSIRRVGRNELCPCGSGKKFKHCCLRNASNDHQVGPTAGRFRFEAGSYGAPGGFLPSVACLEQWQPNKWRYLFVLVRLDVHSEVEAEAVLCATEDLNQTFGASSSQDGPQLAAILRTLGYVRVDDFNIVKPDNSGPVAEQALAADAVEC